MDVYEKTSGISQRILGFRPLRELLHGHYLNPLTQGNVAAPSLAGTVLSSFRPYAQRLLAKLHGQGEPVRGAVTMASR